MKRTKIVATISDRMCDIPLLKQMLAAGMNVVRLNTAHQEPKDSLLIINNVRKISDEIPIMIDTKGPEIRTTSSITVKAGQTITVGNNADLTVNYDRFAGDVKVGSTILIDDGDIALHVTAKSKVLTCKALNGGEIGAKKSVNVPGTSFSLASISEKDKRFLKFAKEQKVDFVAHSFVRNKADIRAVRKLIGKDIQIIAKIENHEGVENIDEILEEADGIMIARGDLGIEIPMERIPVIQAELTRKAISKRKPVITATQMLHTMITNPRPTRAEVNDVATAIFQGTDAVMLSGETSKGKYPVEAIRTMARIAIEAEANTSGFHYSPEPPKREVVGFLAESTVLAAVRLPIKAITLDAETGKTAKYVAAFRSKLPIHTYCYSKIVARQLALSYGIFPRYTVRRSNKPVFIIEALNDLLKKKMLKQNDLVAVLAGSYGPANGPSFLEISTVSNLLE